MPRPSIVLTCAGGGMVRYLLPRLAASPAFGRVVAADANPSLALADCPGAAVLSRIPLPSERYAEALAETLKPFAPAIVVLGADEEVEAIAPFRDQLAHSGLLVNAMPSIALSKFIDKGALGEALAGAGAPAPRQITVANPGEARRAAVSLGYPGRDVVIKRRRGRGRRGVAIVSASRGESHPDLPPRITLDTVAESWSDFGERPLVCEYVGGEAWTADVLADNGRLVLCVGRKWLAHWRFPFPGQMVERNAELTALMSDLASLFGLHGLLDVDLIRLPDGGFRIIEINPRPSGSSVVAVAAGIPIYEALKDILEGNDPGAIEVPDRVAIDLHKLEASGTSAI